MPVRARMKRVGGLDAVGVVGGGEELYAPSRTLIATDAFNVQETPGILRVGSGQILFPVACSVTITVERRVDGVRGIQAVHHFPVVGQSVAVRIRQHSQGGIAADDAGL